MPETTLTDSPAGGSRPSRVEFLDQYRGATVMLMILVNVLAGFRVVPAWLKHATEVGHITITDFVITMFMLAIGVAQELAFVRGVERHGRSRTVWRYVRRGLLLILFGLLGSVLLRRDLLGEWGVLQTIGTAGIIALPFMFLHPAGRLPVAVALAAVYELLGPRGHWAWLTAHDTGRLGGIPGGMAWAGVVLVGSYLGSFVRTGNRRAFRTAGAVVAVAGISLALALRGVLPVYKPWVTATYLLATVGLAAAVLLVFSLLDLRFLPFRLFGVNALAVFMLHGLLSETALSLLSPASRVEVVVGLLVAVYAVCFLVAGLFYRRRIFIRL